MGKRAKRVNVDMLQQIPSHVPKGNQRNKLKEDGRIIELAFNRGMTSKKPQGLLSMHSEKSVGHKKYSFCKQIVTTQWRYTRSKILMEMVF